MPRSVTLRALAMALLALCPAGPAAAQSTLSGGYVSSGQSLSPAEAVGRDIWMFATGFNERYFTYAWPERQGAPIAWSRLLAADRRAQMFAEWGAIPSPDCCTPGEPRCPAKSPEETWGFAWCRGDERLLPAVGTDVYRDPACDLADLPNDPARPRQDACDLRFGTSAGAVGFRKFPNPRFDPGAWRDAGGWDGWQSAATPELEPPFRIGMTCAACHAGLDPADPPADPAAATWKQIDPLGGNPFNRLAALLATGIPEHGAEWQALAAARPGVTPEPVAPGGAVAAVVPVSNAPGRPLYEYEILRWRPASACPEGPGTDCWCEAAGPEKCWKKSAQVERVPHLLAGGEDNAGFGPALQRSWLALGACAEQCVLNHLPAPGLPETGQRGASESPVDPGQCRRDCAPFRAIEDRLDEVIAYLATARPPALWRARGLDGPRDLEIELDAGLYPGAVEDGRGLYARHCARCHSGQRGPWENAAFRAEEASVPDWLGSEQVMAAGAIGLHGGRAGAGRHGPGQLWSGFAAAAPREAGYRAPSLAGAWARAPFGHARAFGPEPCAGSARSADCAAADPSAEARYRVYLASMEALLTPGRRAPEVPLLAGDVAIPLVPASGTGPGERGLALVVPRGLPVADATALDAAALRTDLRAPPPANGESAGDAGPRAAALAPLRALIASEGAEQLRLVRRSDGPLAEVIEPGVIAVRNDAIQDAYSRFPDRIENAGHRFGESLGPREKAALIAFVATL